MSAPPLPPFDTGAPHAGRDLSAALGRLVAEGTTFLQQLPAAAFAAPQGSAWSPSEHVRHLRKSSAPLVTALGVPRLVLGLRFGTAARPSRSFDAMVAVYRQALTDGATAGRFTPSGEGAALDRTAVLEDWARVTGALQARLARWDEAALDRYQLPHPVLGLLTVREMLAFTVYHTAHHLRRVAERSRA